MRKITGLLIITICGCWSLAATAIVTLPPTLEKRYAASELLDGYLAIKAPAIAENGAMVSVTIGKVKLPSPNLFVEEIALYKEYKIDGPVTVFRLGRNAIATGLRTRIRLSKSTKLFAFARLSNGQVLVASQEVKVTIGGCGGGGVVTGSYDGGGYSAPDTSRSITRSRSPVSGSYGSSDTGFQAGILTAADIDDNLNFRDFRRYLQRFGQGQGRHGISSVDLSERVTIKVKDGYGQGVSHARVAIVASQSSHPVLKAYTGSDGVLQFYPGFSGNQSENKYRITVRPSKPNAHEYDLHLDLRRLSYDRTFNITLRNDTAILPSALDLMLVIDTTGSMSDELSYLTREFKAIVGAVRAQHPSIDMRFGLVVYRDRGDEYVVRNFNFTRSVDEMQKQLQKQFAGGGGDMPEAMDQAVNVAIQSGWREGNIARVMFLAADAPPHRNGESRMIDLSRQAKEIGVRIYSLAASGVNNKAEYIMRLSSAITQGRYLFLTDDSGVGNKHAEPKVACYVATRLDQLMIRAVASELAGKRIEPNAGDIIRRVGHYQKGVCNV